MKEEIQTFNSPIFGSVRTAGDPETPLFCLADVCKALDIKNPSRAKSTLKGDGVHTMKGVSSTTNQYGVTTEQEVDLVFISEANLYRCIFQSRKKEAEAFQDWIVEEVIPAIRKDGGYMISRTDDTEEMIMARAVIVANSTIQRQKQRISELEATTTEQQLKINYQLETIEKQAPKVEYYDKVLASPSLLATKQVAQYLGMTSQQLNRHLRDCGIQYFQCGQWLLRAPFVSWDLHKPQICPITRKDGSVISVVSTKWNQRGLRFICELHKCNWDVRQAIDNMKQMKGGVKK